MKDSKAATALKHPPQAQGQFVANFELSAWLVSTSTGLLFLAAEPVGEPPLLAVVYFFYYCGLLVSLSFSCPGLERFPEFYDLPCFFQEGMLPFGGNLPL